MALAQPVMHGAKAKDRLVPPCRAGWMHIRPTYRGSTAPNALSVWKTSSTLVHEPRTP